jgi:hypothetical protein
MNFETKQILLYVPINIPLKWSRFQFQLFLLETFDVARSLTPVPIVIIADNFSHYVRNYLKCFCNSFLITGINAKWPQMFLCRRPVRTHNP